MDARVDSYLRLLGIPPSSPDLTSLNRLIRRHLEVVPFETLSLHSGERVELDIDWLLDKLLARRRGGFCYELGGAFAWLLDRLGYEVECLAARVYDQNLELGMPFDHLTLEVMLEKPYLVDVGFGDSPRSALPISVNEALEDGTRRYRLTSSDGSYVLERHKDDWKAEYCFERTAHTLREFEPGSVFHQSRDSPFALGPICSLLRGEERVTLQKKKLIRTAEDGSRHETPIANVAEFMRVLHREFGIELSGPVTLPA